MKKLISKIKKSFDNNGSSLVLVIVALGFIGILTGALLTAVGYAYRLKLYDYNAKSNFHYLEQAMDEIYAGVGSKTMRSLQEAYEETREEVIYFDPNSKTYKTKSDQEANDIFKKKFMSKVSDETYYSIKSETDPDFDKCIVYDMENMITNSTVQLDPSNMTIKFEYMNVDGTLDENGVDSKDKDGNPIKTKDPSKLAKIIIKNVKLTRTAEYNRSTAKGSFTQSIQTDIEIARPDFNVSFGSNDIDLNTLFDYCLIADSGVDFDRVNGQVLTISGNIYAANDFYNKDYNNYADVNRNDHIKTFEWKHEDGSSTPYKMNIVSKYQYIPNTDNIDLYNAGYMSSYNITDKKNFMYDGKNDRSKYSGFYVDSGSVNILADTVIVPGSISVMNGGKLAIYGPNSESDKLTSVWTDEVVLGGYSLPGKNDTKVGSSAVFNADLHVKDDTQIESEYSKFTLNGSYYGFSNSTDAVKRSYIPTVAKDNINSVANIYQQLVPETDEDGNIKHDKDGKIIYKSVPENRGHYNSSAIMVNGENSTIDLSKIKNLYIAGRSYIELSRSKSSANSKQDLNKGTRFDEDGNPVKDDIDVKTYTYTYDEKMQDYKTGESLSVKSTQLAYYPGNAGGGFSSDNKYYELSTSSNLYNMNLFKKYFKNGRIPLIYQETTTGKPRYYIDFVQVIKDHSYMDNFAYYTYDYNSAGDNYSYTRYLLPDSIDEADYKKYADIIEQQFIKDYVDYFLFCVNPDTTKKLDYMGYEEGYDVAKDSTGTLINFGHTALSQTAFALRYPDVDTFVLEPIDPSALTGTAAANAQLADIRNDINARVNELQNVTNYSDFEAGRIAVKKISTGTNPTGIYASGAITKTGDTLPTVTSALSTNTKVFNISIDNNSVLKSDVLGSTPGTTSTTTTGNDADALKYSEEYNLHYNYYKWTLRDVLVNSSGDSSTYQTESEFLDKMLADPEDGGEGGIGEEGITPINYYMNFDELDTLPNGITEINPSNLPLGEYQVYASNKDITIEGKKGLNYEVTGIIVTKGDVYFKNVNKFSGIIISGGKVYIDKNTNIESISSSVLCKNILNECITAASDINSVDADKKKVAQNAVKFLKLFKSYDDIAKEAESGKLSGDDDADKSITNIDYSDVVRYNNWLKNVD